VIRRLLAIAFIFLCTSAAWGVLGGTLFARTYGSDDGLRSKVESTWGTRLAQHAPSATYVVERTRVEESLLDGKVVTRTSRAYETRSLPLVASDVAAKVTLDHRQKGLLWYATYSADLRASYRFRNDSGEGRSLRIEFPFPAQDSRYDAFTFAPRGGAWTNRPEARNGRVEGRVWVKAGETVTVDVAYRAPGLDEWRYLFTRADAQGETDRGVAEVRDFRLVVETDFADVDFPEDAISPTAKERTGTGWRLTWQYGSLISGTGIGLLMPQRLQPGPLAGKISLFAPVSLFFFIVVMLALSVVRRVPLHPMHFFFLSAAFFAFHLLLAYLVDHVSIHAAFAAASAVSVALVVSYLRIVTGARFAFLQAAGAQLVYLVAFSYAFFFKGFTGLAVTIGAILTLFALMQMTARVAWSDVFGKKA
jgi:hypothetical protein